jgi:hypothetical protein
LPTVTRKSTEIISRFGTGFNSKINKVRDLYRGINDFRKGYQPRTIIVKNEKGDVVADSHSIMAKWRNYMGLMMADR